MSPISTGSAGANATIGIVLELEKEALRNAAAIMAASARTAPKAGGIDHIKTAIVDGEDILHIADAMKEKSAEHLPR